MPVVSQMVRAALTVSNLERSRDFYEDVLGLTGVYTEGTATGVDSKPVAGIYRTKFIMHLPWGRK